MALTVKRAAEYLEQYIELYRSEYKRFTLEPPEGPGYPKIDISPYLASKHLQCYISPNGAAIADYEWQENYAWTDPGTGAIIQLESWTESLPRPSSKLLHSTTFGTTLEIEAYSLPIEEVVRTVTFGAIEGLFRLHLPDQKSQFWNPAIVSDIGLLVKDGNQRYLKYLEILRHSNGAAWETRTAWMRANQDVRRDFARAFMRANEPGKKSGEILMPPLYPELGPPITDRLEVLQKAIIGFDELLRDSSNHDESIFHNYLRSHPILLDVYGIAQSKPHLQYPSGEASPTGKSYVEPDFIITYPVDRTYKLIELERPSHLFNTSVGHPRSSVNHASYQIAEWKHFLQNHYNLIKGQFPGINSGCSSTIIISRSSQSAFANTKDIIDYISLVRQMGGSNDVLTYDMLLDKARFALAQLSGLGVRRKTPQE